MSELLAAIIAILILVILFMAKKISNFHTNPPCQHVWRTDKITDVYDTTFGDRSFDHTEVRSQCTKCGTWKKFKV